MYQSLFLSFYLMGKIWFLVYKNIGVFFLKIYGGWLKRAIVSWKIFLVYQPLKRRLWKKISREMPKHYLPYASNGGQYFSMNNRSIDDKKKHGQLWRRNFRGMKRYALSNSKFYDVSFKIIKWKTLRLLKIIFQE